MDKINPEDFSHDNLKGEVRYRGSAVATLMKQGWYPLMGNPEKIYRAAKGAIFGLPNDASAEDIRRAIVERLGQ
jgi:hypothetical protein